jgi:hypothetical protein
VNRQPASSQTQRPTTGLLVSVFGAVLVAAGIGYGWDCDLETMNQCRPFGLWTEDWFSVGGKSGLLLLSGVIALLAGLLWTIFSRRRRATGERSTAPP